MADFDIYSEAEPESELLNRPDQTRLVAGQAGFFAVALGMGVPILGQRKSVIVDEGVLSSGSGLSFAVGRSTGALTASLASDFVNHVPPSWFNTNGLRSTFSLRNHVTKRINPSYEFRERRGDDASKLAAITNELRILANESVRKSRNVILLLAISWHQLEVQGRFWPQLLLEGAPHGNLGQYLRSSQHLHTNAKIHLIYQITIGLGYLHANGVVHCDLKPTNILVFDDAKLRGLHKHGIQPINVKLCDFGCSIILSDYEAERTFQARIGTHPWMSPEMELATPITIKHLPLTDIFSLGLVSANIMLEGRELFAGFSDDAILEMKLANPLEDDISCSSLLMDDIVASCDLSDLVEADVRDLLLNTLRPNAEDRCTLASNHFNLTLSLFLSLWTESRDHPVNAERLGVDALPDILLPFPTRGPSVAFVDRMLWHENISPSPYPRIMSLESGRDSTETKPIPNIPDIAFETLFRSGSLQREAAKEIINDLQRQVCSGRDVTGRAAFELAGASLNGTMLDDAEVGKIHLSQAVRNGSEEAVACAINIFCASNIEIPKEFFELVREKLRENRLAWIGQTKVVLFTLGLQDQVNHRLIGAKTWARECREDYVSSMESGDVQQFLSALLPLYMLAVSDALPKETQKPMFKSDMLSYKMMRPAQLTEIEFPVLIEEVQRYQCLDTPNEYGFTLLQNAVCKHDKRMVDILLEKLQADVNEVGNTPGCYPLWLACSLGFYDIASKLRSCGADPLCNHYNSRSGILHFLTQFPESYQVENIGRWAIDAGVDVNATTSKGVSPLLAAFMTFDYSNGAAIQFLLDNGADPTLAAPDGLDFMTPIGMCTGTLNHVLLETMIAKAPRERLAESKAQAFRWLTNQTRFYLMCEAGTDFDSKLRATLRLIIDPEMMDAMRRNELVDRDMTPLAIAALLGRAHIVEAILDLIPNTPLVFPSNARRNSVLQLAIDSRSRATVEALINHGIDMMNTLVDGGNYLHYAAQFFPNVIPYMVKALEDVPLDRRGGRPVKEILEIPDEGGFTVFALLLSDGYSDERSIADHLRRKYRLEHDYLMQSTNYTRKQTLTSALISLSNTKGLIDVSQVRYLLNLSPKPRFMGGDGKSLLTHAVIGPLQNSSSDQRRAELTKLILRHYPDYENLNRRSSSNLGAVHAAAHFANTTALKILREHVHAMRPRRELPYNELQLGATALDLLIISTKNLLLTQRRLTSDRHTLNPDTAPGGRFQVSDEVIDEEKLKHEFAAHLHQVATYYKILREDGALHNTERDGILRRSRSLPTKFAPLDEFKAFLERATSMFGLDPWTYDEEERIKFASDLRINPQLANVIAKYRTFELVWMHNYFCLRAFEQHFSALRQRKELMAYYDKRRISSESFGFYRVTEDGRAPFESRNYSVFLKNQDLTVEWTRPGRTWTRDEVRNLENGIGAEWENQYGKRENLIVQLSERLGGTVIFGS